MCIYLQNYLHLTFVSVFTELYITIFSLVIKYVNATFVKYIFYILKFTSIYKYFIAQMYSLLNQSKFAVICFSFKLG